MIYKENMMKKLLSCLVLSACLMGCATDDDVLGTTQTQLQTRNYQTRSFDTTDKDLVMRSVLSTMQDLGFIIEKADEKLGTVTGTSFTYASKMTVSVRLVSGKIVVRANAQSGRSTIEEPQAYRNFFNALEQSMFLAANEVE